jgi:hypothetical protein
VGLSAALASVTFRVRVYVDPSNGFFGAVKTPLGGAFETIAVVSEVTTCPAASTTVRRIG